MPSTSIFEKISIKSKVAVLAHFADFKISLQNHNILKLSDVCPIVFGAIDGSIAI